MLNDDYVAWCRYRSNGEDRPVTIHLCNSDDQGAFPVYRESQWIPVTKKLPTHIYTVVIWVTGGHLHCGAHDEDFMECGSYFPDEGVWKVGSEQGDRVVEVSHWMDVDGPR